MDEENYTTNYRKRTARAVLTGMCYSAGSAMRHGSSSGEPLTFITALTSVHYSYSKSFLEIRKGVFQIRTTKRSLGFT
ncbi:hypothetical protein DL752_22010 [Escherichia coli]|nr:hypothetical protein [Escherichia coli]